MKRQLWAHGFLSLALLSLFFSPISQAAKTKDSAAAKSQAAYYDELVDPATGNLRPQYLPFFPNGKIPSVASQKAFLAETRKVYGDQSVSEIPRVFAGREWDEVVAIGAVQRGRALRMFLQDMYSGIKSYAQAGIIPETVVQKIVSRNFMLGLQGRMLPSLVRFPYGVDVIRDAKGVFRVLEDNIGFVGGLGDLTKAHSTLLDHYFDGGGQNKFRNPWDFYFALSAQYQREAQKYGGRVVAYMTPPYSDNEDVRLKGILKRVGIETITNHTKLQFKIKNDGVYLVNTEDPYEPMEKVGFVVLVGEHSWLDGKDIDSLRKLAADEIVEQLEYKHRPLLKKERKKLQATLDLLRYHPEQLRPVDLYNILENTSLPNSLKDSVNDSPGGHGLVRAMLTGQVGSNYGPGTDFVGDKEFYDYVPNLIRFYLNEEPLLQNVETHFFADPVTGELNRELLDQVFGDIKSYVIKPKDGRGGEGVVIGPLAKPEEIKKSRALIENDPSRFLAQLYTAPSRLGPYIVDFRPLMDIGPDYEILSPTPWGRGVPYKTGNGKMNMSSHGTEIATFVEAAKPIRIRRCSGLFK